MAKEIAAKRGYLLSFMGKPITERGGSGIHVNLSLVDETGNNALLDDSAPDRLSAVARQCIAGIVNDHVSMTALVAPTVNAYKRLQPESLNGYYANWGFDHRGVAVRVPPPTLACDSSIDSPTAQHLSTSPPPRPWCRRCAGSGWRWNARLRRPRTASPVSTPTLTVPRISGRP